MDRAESLPPGGTRADARRSRARLLAAARAAFAEGGVEVSFNEIARSAGVGPATLYRHFPRREDLIAAVVGDSLAEVTTLAGVLGVEDDPATALQRWVAELVSHIHRVRGLSDEIVRALEAPDSALAPYCAAALTAADSLLTRAKRAGRARPDVTTDDIIELATAIAWADNQSAPTRDTSERLLDLLFHGIVRPAEGDHPSPRV
ncbi:TetR/AcrR family transcriptional regulator [Nocardia sp. NBC_00508]|uniref:TetR/AcrR family transcriptional regulator n=1 Tax=Nocardia sp. NBC_00508 TaxID=2975992 RepID=UPI002E80C7C8|nr:TetR/AcrR family transcriptional regulator [Nocardia sp. NBC_00508]WUD67359.1 TetR/AcrR family transcriptional regulator [Nocardia sp. NBC_00508]